MLAPLAIGLLLAIGVGPLHAATLIRGPYLQRGTPDSVVVRWRTNLAHHHTDPGVITLLLQDDVGGLQTFSQSHGWIDVPPHPGAIVVNMSDMLQVLTNDNYRASLHRVLPVPQRDRYSIVYFSMPRQDARIAPAHELYDGEPAYRSFAWAEFIGGRLGDNFADYGIDDIQISDYRLTRPADAG